MLTVVLGSFLLAVGAFGRMVMKTILTTPTPHISKKHDPKICHQMGGSYGAKIPRNKGTFTGNLVHEPTFTAYGLRLLWHTNPDFYPI